MGCIGWTVGVSRSPVDSHGYSEISLLRNPEIGQMADWVLLGGIQLREGLLYASAHVETVEG